MPKIKRFEGVSLLNAATLFVAVTTAVLMLLGLIAVLQLLDNSQRRDSAAERDRTELLRISKLIAECTTAPEARRPPVKGAGPSDCFVRTRARSAELADSINAVTIAAAACGAQHPGDVAATRACTEKALSER